MKMVTATEIPKLKYMSDSDDAISLFFNWPVIGCAGSLYPCFSVPAKLGDKLHKQIALLFRWDMTAVFQHDEARMQDRIVKLVTVVDRYHGIFLTPDDQGRLVDEMRVLLDTTGVPG